MNWVLVATAVWLVCTALVAVLIGRAIRLADQRARAERSDPGLPPPAPASPGQPRHRLTVVRDCVQPAERRPVRHRVGRR